MALVGIFSLVAPAFMKPCIKSSVSGIKTLLPCVQPLSVLCDLHLLYPPNPDFGLHPHEQCPSEISKPQTSVSQLAVRKGLTGLKNLIAYWKEWLGNKWMIPQALK